MSSVSYSELTFVITRQNRNSANCFVRLSGEMVELLIMHAALTTFAVSPPAQQDGSSFRRLASSASEL